MSAVVEAVRREEPGLEHAELPGAIVHVSNERGDRSVHRDREGVRGIVCASEQEGVQQILDADALPRSQAECR